MSILPVNFEAFALREEHPHLLGRDRDPRQRLRPVVFASCFFVADDADAFVAHDSILSVLRIALNGAHLAAVSASRIPVGRPSMLSTFFVRQYCSIPSSPFARAHRCNVAR